MDIELVETLKLIIDRYEGRTQGSVFIPMRDFPWYHERNGQLTIMVPPSRPRSEKTS